MKKLIAILFLLTITACSTSTRPTPPHTSTEELLTSTEHDHVASRQSKGERDSTADERSVLTKIVLYLPNRVFDLVDIFRVRARVGPGFAAGVRVTDIADVYLGSYTSLFAGLPGPRMKRTVPVPVGLESHNGLEVSIIAATLDAGLGPAYSPTEIGISLHLLVVGLDLGFDPVEILDFATGIVGVDIRDDDF